MICRRCGRNIESDVPNCPYCGEKYEFWFTKKQTESDTDNSGYDNSSYNTNGIRILAVIAGAMCVVGLFLPFIQINLFGSSLSMSFRDVGSKDFAIFFIAGAVGLTAGAIEQYVFSGIAGIVYAYFFYLDNKDLSTLIGYTSDYLSRGLGYYCMIVGALGLLIFGIVGFGIKLKNK
jgi:hypothetical protein